MFKFELFYSTKTIWCAQKLHSPSFQGPQHPSRSLFSTVHEQERIANTEKRVEFNRFHRIFLPEPFVMGGASKKNRNSTKSRFYFFPQQLQPQSSSLCMLHFLRHAKLCCVNSRKKHFRKIVFFLQRRLTSTRLWFISMPFTPCFWLYLEWSSKCWFRRMCHSRLPIFNPLFLSHSPFPSFIFFLCCYVLASVPASELLFMKSDSSKSCVEEGTNKDPRDYCVAHTHYINYSIAAQ